MKFILCGSREVQRSIPSAAGIYMISDRWRRRVYIGSTSDFRGRFRRHFSKLKMKKHPNRKLQKLFDHEPVLIFSILFRAEVHSLMRLEQETLDRVRARSVNACIRVRFYRRKKNQEKIK